MSYCLKTRQYTHIYTRELKREGLYTHGLVDLQGWRAWTVCIAIPLDTLSVKLIRPYTNAPLPCECGRSNLHHIQHTRCMHTNTQTHNTHRHKYTGTDTMCTNMLHTNVQTHTMCSMYCMNIYVCVCIVGL